MSEITIYQTESGSVEVRLERETLWLSLNQLSELFERDKSVISRHLRNVFKDGELDREATVAKNATVQHEGGREVVREIEFFNLDAADEPVINDIGLAALLVAESSPAQKEPMIRLIMNMLAGCLK